MVGAGSWSLLCCNPSEYRQSSWLVQALGHCYAATLLNTGNRHGWCRLLVIVMAPFEIILHCCGALLQSTVHCCGTIGGYFSLLWSLAAD